MSSTPQILSEIYENVNLNFLKKIETHLYLERFEQQQIMVFGAFFIQHTLN